MFSPQMASLFISGRSIQQAWAGGGRHWFSFTWKPAVDCRENCWWFAEPFLYMLLSLYGVRDMVQPCTFHAAFLASVACKIMGRCFGSIDHTCNVSKLQCRTSASLMRLHSQRINEVISSDRLWAAGAHPDTFLLLRGFKMLFLENC